MSVDIVKSDDLKPVKTKSAANWRKTISLKKEKPKNAHLPSDAQNSKWCSKFLPAVMYWVGNSSYPWTICDEKLSDICYDIFSIVYNGAPREFEANSWSGGFHVVSKILFHIQVSKLHFSRFVKGFKSGGESLASLPSVSWWHFLLQMMTSRLPRHERNMLNISSRTRALCMKTRTPRTHLEPFCLNPSCMFLPPALMLSKDMRKLT